MPDDRPVNPTLLPADLDALSAYLDNQLSPAERAALEARLAAEPALREQLDGLQAVQAALRGLPPLKAPRNLTLTPAQARPAKRISAFPAFVSGLSAVAAIVLIAAGLGILRPAATSLDEAAPMAIAAAPSATASLLPLESPAARMMEASASPGPEADVANQQVTEGALQAEGSVETPGSMESEVADMAFAAVPSPLEETQGYAADSAVAGESLAAGGAAESAAAAMPQASAPSVGGDGLAQLAQATAPGAQDTTRTKEATATMTPSATVTPSETPLPSATPAPTETAVPAPVPVATQVTPPVSESPVPAWLLIGLGGLLIVVSVWAWRRARSVK